MTDIFRKRSSIKAPQRDREAKNEDYNRERKGIIECPTCHNVHFKKKWYASLNDLKQHVKNKELKIEHSAPCPACTMIREHLFEGEIMIENFPATVERELVNLIRNYGERATEHDPQDRIIQIEEIPTGYRVTTTENQLAHRLAKKIKDVFNTVEIHFSHSKEPFEVSRVRVTFLATNVRHEID